MNRLSHVKGMQEPLKRELLLSVQRYLFVMRGYPKK